MPVVRNIKKDGIPDGAVYIGRANPTYGVSESIWHNPFPLKTEKDREKVVAQFTEYLTSRPDLMSRLGELRGKDLVCWCAPKMCHGDVLLELANKGDEKVSQKVPPARIIAITGHRDVSSTGLVTVVTETVKKLTAEINTYGRQQIRVLCGMAKGIDSIVAQTCCEMDVPWTACIPHPSYMANYFKTPAECEAFTALANRAAKIVYVVKAPEPWHWSHNMTRNRYMVDHAHVVWAYTYRDTNWVIANPNLTGAGGTMNAIAYAMHKHTPIDIIRY